MIMQLRVVTKFMKWAGGQSLMARLQAIMERKRDCKKERR